MSIKLAINGFGRIGRLAFRRAYDVGGFEVVAINDLVDADTLAYLLKYDTTHRGWHQDEIGSEVVKDEAGNITVNNLIWKGKKIPVLGQKDPKNLKWGDFKVDLVLECTGRFKGVADAKVHIDNGAKGVIISAPSDKETPTFVYGVNTDKLTADMEVGNSPVENDQLDYAKRCFEEAKGRIVLPVDSVITDSFDPKPDRVIKTVEGNIPKGFQGVDIGPKTRELYKAEIRKAKLVFWNGPMGVFEQPEFQEGTKAICEAIREIKGKAFTVCGGGDSASAVKQFGYKADFSHVSTGGGASLEMIENDGHLPGVDVLM
jgi:3-phosphoglycerate kinase